MTIFILAICLIKACFSFTNTIKLYQYLSNKSILKMPNISQKDNNIHQLKGKKILYIITQSKWGGAQKYVVDLAKYFSKDNEVHIAYGEAKEIDEKFISQLNDLNIKTIAVPYLVRQIDLGKDYLALMEILKIYNKSKYDLVHLNSSKVGLLG